MQTSGVKHLKKQKGGQDKDKTFDFYREKPWFPMS